MKLKEVCETTGLSRKTIRLYEEKALLVPQKERRNGREYREYTESDVHTLQVIASLRKAWFTMEEIRRMQADPAAIRDIFPQYKAWLLAQKSQLDGLISAAEDIPLDSITSIDELSAHMEAETRKLPLPPADVNPHFKYLDEMDTRPKHFNIQETELRLNGMRFIYSWPYKTRSQKWLDDTRASIRADANTPVQDREPGKDPLLLRPILAALTAISVISGCIGFLFGLGGIIKWKVWGVFLCAAIPRGAAAYYKYRKEQRAWIERMNANK